MLWRRMAALAAIGVLVVTCAPTRASAACIGPDGACYEFDEATCALVGGAFLGEDVSCEGLPTIKDARVDIGACCIGTDGMDAQCLSDVTETECVAAGGWFQGGNSSCIDRVCVGACCIPDGLGGCVPEVTRRHCQSTLFGDYKGNGIGCFNGQCNRFAGACCLPDGTCVPDQRPSDCDDLGGVYQGFDTTCSAGSCLGGCCFPDGSCIPGESEDSCFAAGGDFQGWGSDCPPEPCRRVWQAQIDLELTPVNRTLSFLKFDTQSGTRQLTRVFIRLDGKAYIVPILTNDNDVTFPDTAVRITEVGMSMSIAEFTPPNIEAFFFTSLADPSDPSFVPPIRCAPDFLAPGASCDFGVTTSFTSGMPLMWGGLAEADSLTNPADLDDFSLPTDDPGWFVDPTCSGDRCFDVLVLGDAVTTPSEGNFLYDSTEVEQYIVEVIYEWEPLGACCICEGVCIGQTTQAECNAEGQFVSWHQGMTCDDVTCPPDPEVEIVSCPAEDPLPTEVCPGSPA